MNLGVVLCISCWLGILIGYFTIVLWICTVLGNRFLISRLLLSWLNKKLNKNNMPLEDQSGKVHVLKLVCLSFTDWQVFLGDALMIFRFMIYQIEQKCIKITTKIKKIIIQPLNTPSLVLFLSSTSTDLTNDLLFKGNNVSRCFHVCTFLIILCKLLWRPRRMQRSCVQ